MKIFISYRRDDSGETTGRIYDRLADRYGEDKVFLDIDDIPLGEDFREIGAKELNGSAAVLAVIGPKWAGQDHTPSRIQEANDFVRVEVAMALTKNIPVLPLFVRGAAMPQSTDLPKDLHPLCFRNGMTIRAGRDFRNDVRRLTNWIDQLDNAPKTKTADYHLDPLTELLSRQGLAKELEAKKLTGNAGICAIADIDRVKTINDKFGHEVGDQVIKAVAEELSSAVGDRGLVARTGGEEFLIRFFPEYTRQGTEALRKFISAIPERLRQRGLPESTCTVGLSLERFDTQMSKLKEADSALYSGKREGGNRLVQISVEEADRIKNRVVRSR